MRNSEHVNAESHCIDKVVPLWQVLLDNVPTLAMYVLGAIIMNYISTIYAISYLVYSFASVVWFWAKICPSCKYYDTRGCPCGYGKISSALFQAKKTDNFTKLFRQNIVALFPSWFVPTIVGIYFLINSYTLNLLILFLSFNIIGYALIPIISKQVGCKDCDIKEDCPWMRK